MLSHRKGFLLSCSLTIECGDEEGMRYRSAMSSLLQEYGGVRTLNFLLLTSANVNGYVMILSFWTDS